jgi:hypothetical protein
VTPDSVTKVIVEDLRFGLEDVMPRDMQRGVGDRRTAPPTHRQVHLCQ